MEKADECQELQRGEIPDIFENKQSLEENLRMQTNKPELKIQQWLQMWKSMVFIWGKGMEEKRQMKIKSP